KCNLLPKQLLMTKCMKKLSAYFFVLCMVCIHIAFAQQSTTLRGKVLDETGIPIAGVSISVSNPQAATSSDGSGDFTVQYTSPATLQFSALGYVSQEINLTDQTSLTIRLVPTQET